MSQNWLVAVDDSAQSSYVFNYALEFINKQEDHLYIVNVTEQPTSSYVSYASQDFIDKVLHVAEQKAKKILVHYGRKAKEAGVKYTMMKGTDHPGELICRAVKQYGIHQCLVGRRDLGTMERLFAGSTSKYVVENAECNVVVVKKPVGPEEEHGDKAKVIAAEEVERLERIGKDEGEDKEESLESIKAREEAERQRRIQEEPQEKAKAHKLFEVFSLKDH